MHDEEQLPNTVTISRNDLYALALAAHAAARARYAHARIGEHIVDGDHYASLCDKALELLSFPHGANLESERLAALEQVAA